MEAVCLGPKADQSSRSCPSVGLQLCAQRVSGVTEDGLQALYCFRLEVCLEVWDSSANQPAGSLGDLGQSGLVLFFETAEVTEAVECRHRLHCDLVKQLQQLRADAERLQLLHEVKPLVALFQVGQGIRRPVQLAVDDY